MRKIIILLLVLSLSGCSDSIESNINTPVEQGSSTTYEQVCVLGEDISGPWTGSLFGKWLDSDGNQKTPENFMFVEGAGVPSLINDGNGRLIAAFQWFTCDDPDAFDKIAVSFSEDDGKTWSEPESIKIDGMADNLSRPFDPTLAITPDGEIRMFFTVNLNSMMLGKDTDIYSAVSTDGVNYVFEDVPSFSLDDTAVYDSAEIYWNDLWYLIAPKNISEPYGAYFATSEDGVNFTEQEIIYQPTDFNWLGNFYDGGDTLYFYGMDMGMEGSKGIGIIETTDGINWSDPKYVGLFGGDPAYACTDSGDCLLIATGGQTKDL